MKTASLLIVDDEDSIVNLFERIARQEKLTCFTVQNGYEALDFFSKTRVECVVLDINLPSHSGFQILEYLKSTHNPAEVVIITGSGSVEQAVRALKMGAFDYLTKPFDDLEKIIRTLRNALDKFRLVQKVSELQGNSQAWEHYQGLIGKSPAMQGIYNLIESIKKSSASVLIQGESGTGKELVARAIHQTSPRANKPFKIINCAAIPEGLLESELFGHVKGAFTGAYFDKKGLFEEANGGTVFLDEIGEVNPAFQVKLLRVLQNGEFNRVGAGETRHTNVRVISATNKNLKELISQNIFREDLYYRLHVIGMHLAPLRDKKVDIPLLAYHFLKKFNDKLNKNIKEISIDAMQALQHYSWVGNIRELENIIERCVILTKNDIIHAQDLPSHVVNKSFYLKNKPEGDLSRYSYREAKLKALDLFNKSYLSHLLKQTGGNITLASDKAGMDRSNFKKIIRKYDIDIQEFRRG